MTVDQKAYTGSDEYSHITFDTMFVAAVTKFAKTVGDNVLIPVPSLTEADRCQIFSVVVKKNRRWFWQSAKYEPSGFTLQDILRESNVTEKLAATTSLLMPSYEKTHDLSIHGKLGGQLKSILEVEVEGSDSITLESKFSKVQKQELHPKDLLALIGGKHIDTQHQLVTETLKHPRKVLCLVSSSISLGDVGTIRTKFEIKAQEDFDKGSAVASEEADVDRSTSKSMTLTSGCVLAYSVYELNVDLSDGTFTVVLDPDDKGGFHGEDQVDSDVLEDSEEKDYAVIVQLEKSERDSLRDAVLGLSEFENDVDVMLNMIKAACEEMGAGGEEKRAVKTTDYQCDTMHWKYLLNFAGFTFDESSCYYPKAMSPRLASLRCLFEALEELDDDELDCFVKLDQYSAKPLAYLLKNAINKRAQTMKDPDIRGLFESSNAGRDLARELGFMELADGTVGQPNVSAAIHGTLRAVYALWLPEGETDSSCVLL